MRSTPIYYCISHVTSYLTHGLRAFKHCFFLFQAEDGIRDSSVTGVQTSELQSHLNLVCRLLLEKKKTFILSIVTTKSNILAYCLRSQALRTNRLHNPGPPQAFTVRPELCQ